MVPVKKPKLNIRPIGSLPWDRERGVGPSTPCEKSGTKSGVVRFHLFEEGYDNDPLVEESI
jgi:hypothetical protein